MRLWFKGLMFIVAELMNIVLYYYLCYVICIYIIDWFCVFVNFRVSQAFVPITYPLHLW